MDAIIIKGNAENNKILAALAKKIGSSVLSLSDEEFEDFAFGKMIEKNKTNESVDREEIMKNKFEDSKQNIQHY